MRSDSSTESAEQQPAGYYRATSARARRLEAEATTLKVKQYLREVIARCDRMAEEMEGLKWTLFLRQPEPRLKVSPRGV
jgi:hypothetical protein